MRVKFNGKVLSERFYDTRRGDVQGQIQLRQPFGTTGYKQLIGGLAGQRIMVPVRLVAKKRADLRTQVTAIYAAKHTHGPLELEYEVDRKSLGTEDLGKATLVSIDEMKPEGAMAYDSELKSAGWHITLALTFQTLEPPKAAASGFGR